MGSAPTNRKRPGRRHPGYLMSSIEASCSGCSAPGSNDAMRRESWLMKAGAIGQRAYALGAI
jgi:hypothetical protein